MDHVVDFDAVYQLAVVPEFGLHSEELGVELLQVRELYA
jgi:hypothetical protein